MTGAPTVVTINDLRSECNNGTASNNLIFVFG